MKTFHCDYCGALAFFEDASCAQCGHRLGFLPDVMDLAALKPDKNGQWKSLGEASQGRFYRTCANGRNYSVCNWFVPAEEPGEYCTACRLNALVPDPGIVVNQALWRRIEAAKRRLIYTLRQLSLPMDGCPEKLWPRLQFRFLADEPSMAPVVTGHESGVITLNIAEADDAEREKRRTQLREPQRTLVGHLRQESGYYYWDALIANSHWHEHFRFLFGDERADYAEALKAHYANGPAADWAARCVSAHASAHPWEDWAETWAHYLQMVDLLETTAGFGMSVCPRHPAAQTIAVKPQKGLVGEGAFDTMLESWLPVNYALNSLNRGIGVPDLHPFFLSSPALEKLRFIHDIISGQNGRNETKPANPGERLQKAS